MFNEDTLLYEVKFKAIRSSGSGGQHVNKVSSKIELSFSLQNSLTFTEEQKQLIFIKLQHRITKQGFIILQCDESRSQHKNKELVIKRFLTLIKDALFVHKKRVPTKIPKAVVRKRLKNKRNLSDKKANRRKPDLD